jgi:anti-sigma factor RsiW
MAAHVEGCSHCGTLTARLREGLTPDDARRDGGIGGSGCVSEERLIVYAAGGLDGSERAALLSHLDGCDACISGLVMLHRRLALAPVIETPIPAGIQQRAQAALEAGLRELAPAAERPLPVEPRAVPLLSRVRELLRAPVLVPAALAAGALFMVAVQPGAHDQAGSGDRNRAIAPDTVKLRVTAIEATVRSRPSMQSETVATVSRGATVEVNGEERDWYQVRLDGGRQGWVEREAFE